MLPPLPDSWQSVIGDERAKHYFTTLELFLAGERQHGHTIFPPEHLTFRALELTPYQSVNVVLLGQDPYHGPGQAHGLCFSVTPESKPPPSLVNIFRELKTDLGIPIPPAGCLEGWARQGVLLLNTVMTVRANQPLSHRNRGWETFTDRIIDRINAKPDPVVFMLWGGQAQKKASLIDRDRHVMISAVHPSPLSANAGFFGSKPFSKVNAALRNLGKPPIDWRLDSPVGASDNTPVRR
jgi:uracil-DNA glycosylase